MRYEVTLSPAEFEAILSRSVAILTDNLRSSTMYHDQTRFEQHVRDTIRLVAHDRDAKVAPELHPHTFPDITANGYGIEVKYTKADTWLAVGNSVFEGMRSPDIDRIYVVFGKTGGHPEVRWKLYEDCITHVRVSHAPRFVIQMEQGPRLFDHLGIGYDQFWRLDVHKKMHYIRDYARGRLKEGERLWWLDEAQVHSLPMHVRLYMRLSAAKKRKLRAEAALLSPKICSGPRAKDKYIDAALYLLTHHGVFCPQARDLFSAGSVAGPKRGGNYVLRALQDIQDPMRDAAARLESALFVEYWGIDVAPTRRLIEWLRQADQFAVGWRPSDHLFQREQVSQREQESRGVTGEPVQVEQVPSMQYVVPERIRHRKVAEPSSDSSPTEDP